MSDINTTNYIIDKEGTNQNVGTNRGYGIEENMLTPIGWCFNIINSFGSHNDIVSICKKRVIIRLFFCFDIGYWCH